MSKKTEVGGQKPTASTPGMHEASTSSKDEVHLKQNKVLFELVCLTSAMTAQTQGAHWNYTGRDFIGIHKLLDEHYHNLALATDDLAERLRALNEFAPASMKEVESVSRKFLGNYTHGEITSGHEYLKHLITSHQLMSHKLADAIEYYEDAHDMVTHDMLIERKEFHDKCLWMLNASTGDSETKSESGSQKIDSDTDGADKKFYAPALSRTGVYI